MSKRKKQIRISDRDRWVLNMGAIGMVVPYFLQQTLFSGGSLEAVRSLIRRLAGQRPDYRYLRPEPLDDDRVCYRLTNAGRKVVGAPKEATFSLKKQKRVTAYAVTWFICVEKPGYRQLVSLRKYPDLFDLRGRRLPRHPFYLSMIESAPAIGVVLVDHNASPRRMLYKTEKLLHKILAEGWLDDFIRSRRFIVTTLTFHEKRQRLYETHLPREIICRLARPLSRLLPSPLSLDSVRFEFYTVPGLESVIFGSPSLFDPMDT